MSPRINYSNELLLNAAQNRVRIWHFSVCLWRLYRSPIHEFWVWFGWPSDILKWFGAVALLQISSHSERKLTTCLVVKWPCMLGNIFVGNPKIRYFPIQSQFATCVSMYFGRLTTRCRRHNNCVAFIFYKDLASPQHDRCGEVNNSSLLNIFGESQPNSSEKKNSTLKQWIELKWVII